MIKILNKRLIRIISLLLVVIFVGRQNITQVKASGIETWRKGSYTVGTMDITNNNLTPVKTIEGSGTLSVWARFEGRLDSASYPPIVVKVQIRNTSGQVLQSFEVKEQDAGWNVMSTGISVQNSQKIQIFFDVCSQYNPPGPYRMARVTYGYVFT